MMTADRKFLLAALISGLIMGLIFIYLVPPWQHYDEPNHFEYAWLIANRAGLPQPDDFDPAMRQEVLASMVENAFFKGMTFTPRQARSSQPVWIGSYSQLPNPPLYYLLVAGPMRFLSMFAVEDQLYAARMVSLALFLVCILAAFGVACELTPVGHRFRLYTPMGLVLLPGLVDSMTAVNNDAGAIAIFSLYIWGCVRLLRRGFSLPVFLATLAMIGLGWATKETTYIAAPIFIVVMVFTLLRGPLRRVAWVFSAAALLLGFVAVFDWGDAAIWLRMSFQQQATRGFTEHAVLGAHALVVEVGEAGQPQEPYRLYELLPPAETKHLPGKSVSLGGWMWADRPVQARTPILHLFESGQDLARVITVGVEPSFFVFTETIGVAADRAWIVLAPLPMAQPPPIKFFYDGLLLVEGDYSEAGQPQFTDETGQSGVWGGKPFNNLIRNASAETAGLRVRPWADRLGAALLPEQTRPSWIMGVLQDGPAAGWFHRILSVHLFRTFWGQFGWGHVSLLGNKPYQILVIISGLAVLGCGRMVWRRRRTLPGEVVFFFMITLAAAWGLTFVRSEIFILHRVYFPVARYAYPAIIPAACLLHIGWDAWISWLTRQVQLPGMVWNLIYLLIVGWINVWAVVSIWVYYYA